MASFISVLSKIGIVFKDIFKVAIPVAEAAEPIIGLIFPGSAALFNLTISLVTSAEASAAAAGSQAGTGPQKLAMVLAALQPYAVQEANALGISNPTVAQTTAWINGIVAALNAFESAHNPTTPTAPAA